MVIYQVLPDKRTPIESSRHFDTTETPYCSLFGHHWSARICIGFTAMPVESAAYINNLNPAYPASTDGVKEGDDHIRLVKQVIQNTFPNVTGPVTKTQAQLNYVAVEFPIGGIVLWSGSIASIPSGWALCNGQTVARTDNGGNITTPDLRDRFVVGAGTTYNVGATGGANTVTLNTSQMPSHAHTITVGGSIGASGAHTHSINDPGHSHTYTLYGYLWGGAAYTGGTGSQPLYPNTSSSTTGISVNAVGDHTHTLSLSASESSVGGDQPHENRPPYYALAYIMKY